MCFYGKSSKEKTIWQIAHQFETKGGFKHLAELTSISGDDTVGCLWGQKVDLSNGMGDVVLPPIFQQMQYFLLNYELF